MSLTLFNPEADRLARTLAALTGESVEQAVERAIRDQLAREQEQRTGKPATAKPEPAGPAGEMQLLHDVQAIAHRFRQHAGQPFTSLDHGELLYDETGLPR